MLLAALNQMLVATALPEIVSDLGGFDQYSWVIAGYMLASTVTVPIYGKLSDIYGRKPLFTIGIAFFMAGSFVCGMAPSMTVLIVGRIVQGLGAGGLIPLAMAVIADLFSPRDRGKWQGITGAVFAVSSVAGPALGGWLTDSASWRWCFFISLPLGAVAFVVVWFGFQSQPARGSHQIDFVGAGLLTMGVSSGLLAVMWGGVQYPWESVQIVGLGFVALVTLVVFLWWERRVPEPILPLGLFRQRTIAAGVLGTFFLAWGLQGMVNFVPLFVQGTLGKSATSSGAIIMPQLLGMILTSILVGLFVSRTGHYRTPLVLSPFVLGVGFFLLSRLDVDSSGAEVARALVVLGIGGGLGMQIFTLVVQNSVSSKVMGAATASVQFGRAIGVTIGVSILGAILTNRLHSELASRIGEGRTDRLHLSPGDLVGSRVSRLDPAVAGQIRDSLASAMHDVFLVGLPLAAVALVASLLVERRELRRSVHEEPAAAPEVAAAPVAPLADPVPGRS
jgi:EmrB/QacA subfamily drug resistance transporter